jgi:type II secretory ATPase GspE/PulE/Tfp pilus assembly ATPase PilB-like protein
LDLGLKPYVIASALEAIIAQRLVRRICNHCREPEEVSPDDLRLLGPQFMEEGRHYYRGRGCNHCHKGYKGRLGIHEVLLMNLALRDAITEGVGASQLLEIARARGMQTLLDDALLKLNQGLTSVEEVLRLLGPQDLDTMQ